MVRPHIDYYVLDALANDIESLEDIIRLVNHPEMGWAAELGRPIRYVDVLSALPRLVGDKLVQIYAESGRIGDLEALPIAQLPATPLDSCYFGLTAHGRIVHSNWTPSTGTQ